MSRSDTVERPGAAAARQYGIPLSQSNDSAGTKCHTRANDMSALKLTAVKRVSCWDPG